MVAHQISTKHANLTAGFAQELLLYAASGLSLLAATIHLWAVPVHLAEWWGYGAFFVVVALLQGLFAVALLRRPSRTLLFAGIAVNLGVVALYVITRTAGVPFFGPHAGEIEAAGTLDLTATVAELALVATLVALAGEARRARLYLALGAVLSVGTGLLLHGIHSEIHGERGLDFVTHWLQGSVLSLPLSVLALFVATPLARRGAAFFFGGDAFPSRITWALTVAAVYAIASIPANALAMHHASAGAFLTQASRDAGIFLGVGFLLLFAVAQVRGAPWEAPRAINFWRPRAATAIVGLAAGLFVVVGPSAFGQIFAAPPVQAQAAAADCSAANYDRSYDVAADNVDIPYNRFATMTEGGGEAAARNMDPNGQLFVLQGDQAAVKNWHEELGATPAEDPAGANNRRLRPRPLVIRANVGECVKVTLKNELEATGGDGLPNNPRVGMKVYGPSYDAQTSDGSAVGYNADTTVGMGETISYYWKAPSEEGTFLFRDQGALMGSEANSGSTGHGLHGAFVVEPAGSTWRDPETGQPLYAGANDHNRITKQSGDPYIDADILAPGGAFRETVQLSQDELPGGNGFAFNYGAEPAFNRIATNPAGENPVTEQLAPDAIGEETSLSSWTYGDPSLIKLASGIPTPEQGGWLPNAQRRNDEDCGLQNSCYVSNVTHAYPGDATKIRFSHAGVKETHVFHMHAHQWRIEQNDPGSQIIDSQTYGPGESFTASLIGGAGSKPKTVGDAIFHCHLYPHFADGFWALFRVHDVYEDGTGKLPDGTLVRELKRLPGETAPGNPTAAKPGYPRFVPGEYGWRAPQPPLAMSESNGQQDDASTIEREDLDPATRVVRGRPLDETELDARAAAGDVVSQRLADKLELENQNMLPGAKPGAPFAEPCPRDTDPATPGNQPAREVTYNVSVIQTDIVYNERGDHDTQGRIMVLTEDVDEVLAGTKKPEPLYIRVNAGDCINFNLTNHLPNWYGGDAFVELAQTNMVGGHIHLVKFDVLASDGSSNGWNYQQAAFSDEQADFNKEIVDSGAGGQSPPNCNWNGCRITEEPADWDPNNENSSQIPPGQTISERWYADTELRTVFTHNHHFAALDQNRGYFGAMIVEPEKMDFRNPRTGEYYAPINNAANVNTNDDSVLNDQVCPENGSCVGNAAGAAMDIIGTGPSDDFREFGLAIQDFVSLTRAGGDSANRDDVINGPTAPEEFPDADPGTMAINYRNAPFQYRDTGPGGDPSDPAHVFSSTVHGDPMTPILQTYSGDPVRIRAIQGSQEEQHVLSMNGIRWREEFGDPNSPLVNAKSIGISEAFNFEVPQISCADSTSQACAGDYLYGGTATDDKYLGAWGLLRARAEQVPSLRPLPDNDPAVTDTTPEPGEAAQSVSATSSAPPEATSPGNPCPTNAPVKTFNVVAMQARIDYNEEGDNDPYGLVYALAEDEAAIRSGELEPEPLVLRANQKDCIRVRLTNKLTNGWLQGHGNAGTNGDPTLPTEPASGTRAGLRVSMNPQLVKYDVQGSDGAAVGFNRDSTVAPGETRDYRWYADSELGTTNLTDFGDVRGHRHHGLFAGLNIEPENATYHDPETGDPITSGVSADIRVPNAPDFREFTTFFQDGLNLRDASGAIIEDPLDHPPTPEEPAGEPMDAEDMGEKGFNYASSPFEHRIGANPETGMEGDKMAHVFDSSRHGDPDTPIYRAFEGDDIRMRILQGSDKPRQHSFQVSGASWKAQPNDPGSNLIGTQGGISVGRTLNLELSGFDSRGDYRYGCGVAFHHLSGGLWGIVRVYDKPAGGAANNPTPIGTVDNPHTGGHPVLPLEIQNVATNLTLNATPTAVEPGAATVLSGKLTATGGPLSNRSVVIESRPAGGTAAFETVQNGELTTNDQGNFRLAGVTSTRATEYRAQFAGRPGTGLEPTTSATIQVAIAGDTALQASGATTVFGEPTSVTGTLTKGGTPLANKPITLEQRPTGQTGFSPLGSPVNTNASGRFTFADLRPQKNTDYRVRFAGETGAGLRPSEAIVQVRVRAAVTLTAAATDLKLGQSRPLSGTVSPAHTGTVELVVKRNGASVLTKALPLDAASSYRFSYKPTSTGNYTAQVTFAGDADHLNGSSPIRSFKVVR